MKIGIASDHAGYNLKSSIIQKLQNSEYQFIDYGTNNAESSVDYSDFANKLCLEFIDEKVEFGILICGSGIGISIAANRFKKVRAALCCDDNMAALARKHNDANIICLGSRIIDENIALQSIQAFLSTDFEGGRHQKRVEKLSK